MNVLRQSWLRQASRTSSLRLAVPQRTFSATRIRRAEPMADRDRDEESNKPTPQSPSFYTTRAVYYDQLAQLEKTISHSESFLRKHHLLPLPEFARASLPKLRPMWKDQMEMASEFKTKMTMTRYRRVTQCLNQINEFQNIAVAGGCPDLATRLNGILSMYESSKKEAYLNKGKRKIIVLDQYGRSYTLGKRKTSSARVWMIPVKTPITPPSSEPTPEALLGVEEASHTYPVTISTILVNNLPMHEVFKFPQDREKITRPLKVAGVLGKYNIFAIVRGGGTTGQSGALAHGIAKGIVAHEPELEAMFRRSKLSKRDPRMVERKKTGLAKARKRYTWVKR